MAKFDKTGKFLTTWGTKGSGPGQFVQPHSIAMDSQGRIFVGDRGNNRIETFAQEGTYRRDRPVTYGAENWSG